MRRLLLSVGLTAALLASAGCSLGSMGKSTGKAPSLEEKEIAALKAHIVELQQRAAVAGVEMARLEKRLAVLENSPSPSTPAAVSLGGASSAGGGAGSMEIPERAVPQIEAPRSPSLGNPENSELEVSDLPAAPRAVESIGGGADSVRAPDPVADRIADPGGSADAGENAGLTASAQALYDRGYTLYHQGHYVDSETAFQQFLRRHSATVLGDNAQFWIAEARHARGDVSGALAAYRETATRFPGGNKVPDAQLKIGDCLRELGDTEGARQSYRRVISDFPGAAAATAARKRLVESP